MRGPASGPAGRLSGLSERFLGSEHLAHFRGVRTIAIIAVP